ncbi:MAG: FAD-dependent oxidoreductase [Ignavibacteria bacterium]|nr:FAD-dependent oxidoreductase [Ignavibacteria bacterium]
MHKSRIIIIGGGFAGVKCARTLRKKLSREGHEIVIFNRENHMVFHPLLAEVAGASINPDAVAAPLRQMLPGVSCRTEEVQSIDLDNNSLEYLGHDGHTKCMTYDHVVIASGAAVNLGIVPGMADHAFPLKTVGDAMALRAHVMQQFEKAEVCENQAIRRWYLSFIIVGGGYSGVEAAGEINDLARGSRRFFRNISVDDINVKIIHSREQLLPEISPRLREAARVKMEKAGIDVVLNTRVAMATPQGVGLEDGQTVRGATVVCTVGSKMSQVVERLDIPKERGQLLTEADMRLRGRDNAWAVGDCARIINEYDGTRCPPTGQFAERQGRQAANNITRVLDSQTTKPFRFKPLGQLCAIGGHTAVAEFLGSQMSGFLAWFLWRSVYLFKLPSWSRRFKVGFDWAWELAFARDLLHLKTDQSRRISNAYYAPGDYIFRQGAPAMNFYIIEKGEAEVLRRTEEDDSEEILTVLGPGDFFGEMALIDNRPRSASVRARTALEVVVMGRNVFSEISTSLAPLRDLLVSAARRRATSLWQRMPLARDILQREPLSSFVDPMPVANLKLDDTFEHAIALFNENMFSFCCIIDDHEKLCGILTRTDLFRAFEAGARRHTHLSEIMVDPITVTIDDSVLVAGATMRGRGLKWLPVIDNKIDRRVIGYLRAEKMFLKVFQNLPSDLKAQQVS